MSAPWRGDVMKCVSCDCVGGLEGSESDTKQGWIEAIFVT